MRRLSILLAFLVIFGVASAQRCQPELTETLQRLPEDSQPGVVAAELMARAVRLVEPALPRMVWTTEIPLESDEPGFDAVRYLVERRLLPNDWQAQGMSAAAWREMLGSFASWYGLEEPVSGTGGQDTWGMILDLAYLLERVGEAVRPALLIASEARDASSIAFLGLVWNWTIYPRLIVLRPTLEHSLADGPRPLLEQFSNCAVDLRHYVMAPEETARSLFLAHSDSRMLIIGSEPQLRSWPQLVPEGEEPTYFSFAAPEVADLQAFSAAFEGDQIGVTRLMSILPRVRTNLPPHRIPGLLSSPVRN